MQKMLIILLAGCFLTTACSKKVKPVGDSTDFVTVTLGEAAGLKQKWAHSDLAPMLRMSAKLRGQGLQPLLPPADPSLQKLISVSWTGEVSGVLKEICLKIGYAYEEVGTPSAHVMTVVVHGLNHPAHKIIEDIAWQIQPQGIVRIDPITRTLTLAKSEYAEVR